MHECTVLGYQLLRIMHVARHDNAVIPLYYDNLVVINVNLNLVLLGEGMVVDVGTENPDDDAGQKLLLNEQSGFPNYGRNSRLEAAGTESFDDYFNIDSAV